MNIRTQKALTLTELLVSTILIAIVMVGVASFSFVIKQLQSTTDKSGLLSMRLAAAMNRMSRDALLTVGDPSSLGIQSYSNGIGGTRSICFRNDVNDPLTYADDKWICYFYDSGGTNILKRCDNPDPPSIPPSADAQCDTAPDVQTFLPLSNINFFNVVNNVDGRLDYVEITLTGRYDITKAAHVIENPEQVVTIQISPPNYGR